jgi:CSLREA domain-containing protein
MNKSLRVSVPFILACLMLGVLFYLTGSYSQVLAAETSDPKSWVGKPLAVKQAQTQATLTVTTLEDELNNDGDCSLREAIQAANTNTYVDACGEGDVLTDTITFAVAGTITVTSQLSVTANGPLVIEGGDVITTSGGGTTLVWGVDPGSTLAIQNLTVIGGSGAASGGLYNSNANIHIANCTFAGNFTDGCGGGIHNSGVMIIDNSTFSFNIGGRWIGLGGGICNNGVMTITSSTFFSNTANDVFGGNGASLFNNGTLTIINSTFSKNISDHEAITNGAIMTITNSTITDNESAGINSNVGSIFLINSIIANNALGDCTKDLGVIIDGGHNISLDDSCGFSPANGSMPNTDPLLGPLQDNGGPSLTHALLEGSPAIDAGEDAHCPPTDQRGVLRPLDGNEDGLAVCDIGSYERETPLRYYLPVVTKSTGAPLSPNTPSLDD